MKQSIIKGFGFGITSGVITTLGMIIGLHSGVGSKAAIISGILVIAVADALSDALGMHVSEESQQGNSQRTVWEATISTFFVKFIISLSFIIPIILLPLNLAIIISAIYGLALICFFSYFNAKRQKSNASKAVIEHLFIAIIVIIAAHYVGDLASKIS